MKLIKMLLDFIGIHSWVTIKQYKRETLRKIQCTECYEIRLIDEEIKKYND